MNREIDYSRSFIEEQMIVLRKLNSDIRNLQVKPSSQDTSVDVQGSPDLVAQESPDPIELLREKAKEALRDLQDWQRSVEKLSSGGVSHISSRRIASAMRSEGPTTSSEAANTLSCPLVSQSPIMSLLGIMPRRNCQLAVDVFEARGLKISSLSSSDLTYCLVYLKEVERTLTT